MSDVVQARRPFNSPIFPAPKRVKFAVEVPVPAVTQPSLFTLEKHSDVMRIIKEDPIQKNRFASKKQHDLYVCIKWLEMMDPAHLHSSEELRIEAANIILKGSHLLEPFQEEEKTYVQLINAFSAESQRIHGINPSERTTYEAKRLATVDQEIVQCNHHLALQNDFIKRFLNAVHNTNLHLTRAIVAQRTRVVTSK